MSLILVLDLVGTFVFGLSGGLAAVRARLDLFGVIVVATVAGLAGGTVRDVLIGISPTTFRDWRYLAIVFGSGLVCCVATPLLHRLEPYIQLFDAMGLALFCVAGTTTAFEHHLGGLQAVVLGTITGCGGGILRDVLLREIPIVLRRDLYAVPAVLGAAIVTIAHEVHAPSLPWSLVGAALCLAVRLLAIRYQLNVPAAPFHVAPRERREPTEPN